ncbi:hypothetical protein [Caulobacter sp. UC70_42]|uniref:hypothetical protein n=1 Tax=Caulobacter sp. UC70_42 TaxID=3374551 RepID=UPI00375818AF
MTDVHDESCETHRHPDCDCNCTWKVRKSISIMTGHEVVLKKDTIGQAIDALNAGVAMVNAASERMQALGLRPHISVNGCDYGDKISVRLDGDLA